MKTANELLEDILNKDDVSYNDIIVAVFLLLGSTEQKEKAIKMAKDMLNQQKQQTEEQHI